MTNVANFCERLMNRMVVMRGRFLDPLEKNRLNATVDVLASERCGASADTSLLHMPPLSTFQTLSIFFHKVPSVTKTFRFRRAAFVMDKALHSGLFVLHRR